MSFFICNFAPKLCAIEFMITLDILLVTYNQEQYIQQALDGILMQRVNPDVQVRIVVADDCSTDNTLKLIKESLGTETKIASGNKVEVVYLPSEYNMGHVHNYQRTFSICIGDYIAIIEGDDYWSSPLHLQKHVDFLDVHCECVLTSQRPTWYFEDQKRFEPSLTASVDEGEYKNISTEEEVEVNRIVNLSSCVIRGNAIRNLDERIFDCSVLDWPMYVNLSQMGLLCILTGTSNVYRAKSSGLYAGLNKEAEVRMDDCLLCEIENIFPQYKESYRIARRLIHPKPKSFSRRIIEYILWPFVKIDKLFHYICVVYKELKQ